MQPFEFCFTAGQFQVLGCLDSTLNVAWPCVYTIMALSFDTHSTVMITVALTIESGVRPQETGTYRHVRVGVDTP